MTPHAANSPHTSRPRGAGPAARYALWRPERTPGIELQAGVAIVGYDLPIHFHDLYQFDLVEAGARAFTLPGETRSVGAERLTVVHPGQPHAVRFLSRDGTSFRTMHVETERLVAVHRDVRGRDDPPSFAFEIADPATVALYRAAHLGLERDGPDAAAVLDAFLERLVARHVRPAAGAPDPPGHGAVHRARAFIEANLSQALTLDEVAAAAGLSKFHLVRRFTAACGLPPHAYQVRAKLVRARRLLAGGLSAAHVAAELGFADQSHFGRHFLRTVGLSPAEYQRSVTGRAGAPRAVPDRPAAIAG
ncbi:helix-turn-helix domain-containing protein [Azospirillum sp. ST 5-10]|uniref:helix-turn-helix domain-containing protein n=1 Tax=unclassified Azospirillum TaxID=2630922 RepID=UPI003F4A0F9C